MELGGGACNCSCFNGLPIILGASYCCGRICPSVCLSVRLTVWPGHCHISLGYSKNRCNKYQQGYNTMRTASRVTLTLNPWPWNMGSAHRPHRLNMCAKLYENPSRGGRDMERTRKSRTDRPTDQPTKWQPWCGVQGHIELEIPAMSMVHVRTTEYRGTFSRYLPWRKILGTAQHYFCWHYLYVEYSMLPLKE